MSFSASRSPFLPDPLPPLGDSSFVTFAASGSPPGASPSTSSQTPSFFGCAPASSSRFFAMASAAALTSAFFLANNVSNAISSKCSLVFSGRPKRTVRTPARLKPSAMLSTATLLSEVARTGDRPNVLTHIDKILTDTWVFPVPGGPWTILHRVETAFATASRWESLRSLASSTDSSTLSLLVLEAPPSGPRPRGSSRANITNRVSSFFSPGVVASCFSNSFFLFSSSKIWAIVLRRQGGTVLLEKCCAQSSSLPTSADTIISQIGSVLSTVTKCMSAPIWRS
mmetsp:Transcript_112753/g.282362  ORF Transcript_112753/g.282362 Transcript_112753/m.282362 type:complete len:283 (-) Transcript_112753:7-855(-)